MEKAAVSELRMGTLVDFAESVDTGNEIAGQNNKDKYEEKVISKEAAS